MLTLLANLRQRPLLNRAVSILAYGLVTFFAIYYLGFQILDNILLFHILEVVWFIHILFIANKIQRGQGQLFTLALLGLSPGILRNLIDLFSI